MSYGLLGGLVSGVAQSLNADHYYRAYAQYGLGSLRGMGYDPGPAAVKPQPPKRAIEQLQEEVDGWLKSVA